MRYAPQNPTGAHGDFEPWELDLIRSVVLDFLSTRSQSPDFEFDDLVQECTVHWWRRRSEYDESRGASKSTFLRSVVRARLLDIERAWKAAKRGRGRRPLSLDASISDDDERQMLRETLRAPGDFESPVGTATDLQRLTARLSERQRKVIAGAAAGLTRTELSQRLRVSRDTLHEELRRIQQVFREEGLAPYLD